MKKILNILFASTILYSGSTIAQCGGCPTVNAQMATGPSTAICSGQTVALTASATAILGANTNNYTISSIPYAAQPMVGGATAVTGADDSWGGVQTCPFPICYFGNQYTQFICGSNGVLSFQVGNAFGYCPWPINTAWPSLANITATNDIGIPYRDFTCFPAGSGAYWYVSGVSPNRTLVVYWKNMNLFSCGTPVTNSELIYYEATCVIEIHVQTTTSCPGWNSGAGILGIQKNPAPGVIAPARNFPGAWSTANEAWRFSPAPATPSWTWTGPGGVVGTGTAVVVSPTVTTIYTAACTPGCPGGTVQVVVNTSPTLNPTNNGPVCQGLPLNIFAGGGGANTTYTWTGPGSYTSNAQNPVIAPAQPSNSGVYSLTASNNFTAGPSCFASSTTTASVVPVDQVTVTPNFTLCQGAALNLTAQNGTPPNSYSWAGPSAFTSTLQNPVIGNMGPSGSGNYIVTATYATPGITLVCTSTAVTNVSIVATSPVSVTIPANICEHTTANLTCTSNPVALSYAWTGPNSFVAAGTSTSIPNIPAAASGSYNVVGTWAMGTVSCNVNGFSMMSVVPVNPVTINAPILVCYPGNVNLSANSQGAISYNWTGPNSFTSNLASPVIANPLPVASGVYSVTTAYTNGALVCYNGDTTHVTVNPTLPFSLTPYRQVCFNSNYTMSGPAGATSYSWVGSSGVTSTAQVLSIPSIQAPQAGDYTLTVMLGPCTTTGTTKVDVLSPISFSNTPGNTVICAGDSVKLIMGSKGGSGNYAYVWNPQIYLGSPTGSVQYGHPDNTTIYNVYGYDISCPDYSVSTAFTVTVNRAPVPDLKLDNVQACQPLCLVYNSRTQNDATSITYDFGNGNIMQADSFAYCLNDPGTYNLKITTQGRNGCKGVYSHPTPIVVWPTPHSDVSWNPEQPTTTNNHVTFNPTNQYGPVVKYNWMFQGTKGGSGYDTAATRNPSRIYDSVGKYPVLLISTTDKGCVDTVFKVLNVIDEFAVFIPNTFTPNGDGLNDVFNIKGIGLKTEGYTMEIYDRWGSLLYSTKDVMKGWDGTVKGLNAENGVYVYKIKATGANGEGKKDYVGHVSLLK